MEFVNQVHALVQEKLLKGVSTG